MLLYFRHCQCAVSLIVPMFCYCRLEVNILMSKGRAQKTLQLLQRTIIMSKALFCIESNYSHQTSLRLLIQIVNKSVPLPVAYFSLAFRTNIAAVYFTDVQCVSFVEWQGACAMHVWLILVFRVCTFGKEFLLLLCLNMFFLSF